MNCCLVLKKDSENTNYEYTLKKLKKKKYHFFIDCYVCKNIKIENIYLYDSLYIQFEYNNNVYRCHYLQLIENKSSYIMEITKKNISSSNNTTSIKCSLTIEHNTITCITITIN
jgi:uncharacterized LabA/DUF88 family protein